jgi:hypothetical protein
MRINSGSGKGEPGVTRPRALKGWRQPARAKSHQNERTRQVLGVSGLIWVEPTLSADGDKQLWLIAVRFALTASQWNYAKGGGVL